MPKLIRTPEDIFRSERRDVYALEFREKRSEAIQKTRQEMQDWFSRNLPNSRTETPAPSEHSGWIMGGPSSLRIAFTDADLATFCAQWERLDGTRLDPRFQCGIYADVDWWRLHGHFMPTFTRPEGPEVSV